MMGARSALLLLAGVLCLLASARATPVAEGRSTFDNWWSGNSVVPVSQLVDEGAEKMGQHLTQFMELCDRFLSFRARRDDDAPPSDDEAASRMSSFFVERVFHPPAAKANLKDVGLRTSKRSAGNTPTPHCSEPFGVSHPACDPSYSCSISQMVCQGVEVNPKTYNGSLAGCTVNKVDCVGGPIPKLLPKNACVLRNLTCSGGHVSAADAPPGAAATCSVYQVMCNDTLLNFDPSTTACDKADASPKCKSLCKDAGDVCTCTLDRVGRHCEKWRPYTCTFRLLSPTPNCKPIPGVDSDPVCFEYTRPQTAKFEYAINCTFDDHLDPLSVKSQEFDYFLRTNKFAVSRAQADLWTFRAQLKVFDFKWISDRTATQVVDLTPLQLAGNASVAFSLNFAQIPDRFFAGNRLYFEFGLSRDSNVDTRTIKYDRQFVDFAALHIPRTNHSALSAVQISWIIAFSIFGFFFLVLVGYWIRNKIIACRRPKEHEY